MVGCVSCDYFGTCTFEAKIGIMVFTSKFHMIERAADCVRLMLLENDPN